MTVAQGRRVYDHIQRTGAKSALECGTFRGASAGYIGAALEETGGHLVTIDHVTSEADPRALREEMGLLEKTVEVVRVSDSSYDWWLLDQIEAQTTAGVCEPIYDFVHLDGAHNATVDGLAVILIEKLLRTDGWLLMDDLLTVFRHDFVEVANATAFPLSEDERKRSHMRRVFD